MRVILYADIIKQAKDIIGEENINDIRPATTPHIGGNLADIFVKNAIVVWLKNGSTILYFYKDKENENG